MAEERDQLQNSSKEAPEPAQLAGQRVTVMGLGQFGGGLGAVQFLLECGAKVTLTDLRSQEELAGSLNELDLSRIDQLVLGEHRDEDFTNADCIVVNPAVRREGNHYLDLAKANRIPLTSEINLFWQHCRGKKIIVTGSVGKSTTATLLYQCLQEAGVPSRLGGNIGVSLLPQVHEIEPDEWIVLELSSFQLADLDRLHPRPELAVVTNFFPNHLDWHGTLESYREAKQSALCWQTEEDLAVLNGDDVDSALWPTDARVIWYGREIWQDRAGVYISDDGLIVRSTVGGWRIELTDLAPCLRHPHMVSNVAAALAAVVVGLEIPVDRIASALLNYETLPHRLEQVAVVADRTFINDSKATTPEAMIAALKSVSSPVLLIAGGKDKGIELSAAADEIVARVKKVALIGETADRFRKLITDKRTLTAESIFQADSLEEAMKWLWQQSSPSDVILLSPACASHGQFINFEERGERFVEIVHSIENHLG